MSIPDKLKWKALETMGRSYSLLYPFGSRPEPGPDPWRALHALWAEALNPLDARTELSAALQEWEKLDAELLALFQGSPLFLHPPATREAIRTIAPVERVARRRVRTLLQRIWKRRQRTKYDWANGFVWVPTRTGTGLKRKGGLTMVACEVIRFKPAELTQLFMVDTDHQAKALLAYARDVFVLNSVNSLLDGEPPVGSEGWWKMWGFGPPTAQLADFPETMGNA